jgi:hypothetical protein
MKFNVRVNSTYSDIQEQEMGVPKGSILSVTLFSIKINNLAKVLSENIEGFLYVDDFLNMNNIERQLQICLNKIEQWAMENGMHFCNKRGLNPDSELKLYNSPITIVSETKFVGLLFDSTLIFLPHIKMLKNKSLKALNI